MFELKCDRFGIEANVETIDYRTRHRNREMRFIHCRYVQQHQCHCVIGANAVLPQRGSKLATAVVGFEPATSVLVVDQRTTLGIDRCSALDERER